jgi:eukaryotic-like serine/threonine-protein kinase
METLEPGAIFADDYRVVRPLASGGMGAVYVVDQLSTGKSRALKLMRPELAGDEELRRRFQQEARIGGKIESEHIVEIHSAGVDDKSGVPFIVMELLVGEDLATRVERTGPLAPAQALDLFEQLCHAVAAAHDAGIVHRDLKPENIFLAEAKRAGKERAIDVKVLDFGIAKIVAESATRGKTTAGMIGTPLWMAPEQTEPGKLTPSADVWALGLILYYVLTGAHYWRCGADSTSTYAQILKEVCMGPLPGAAMRAREQGIGERWPQELDVVFARSVVREPVKRYRDARLFGNAIRDVLARYAPAGVPSSGRMLAAASSSSARIHAGASPESAQDPTMYATPVSAALRPPAAPFSPPLLETSFGGLRDVAGIPVRALIAAVSVLLMLGLSLTLCVARRRALEPREHEGPRVLAPGVPANPAAALAPGCRARLCTGDVTTSGPLDRASAVASVERAFTILDAQCLGSSRAGSATIAFTVREGRATNRRVEYSSSSGAKTVRGRDAREATDECISRALGDVTFPSFNEGTYVTYTLRWDPTPR